MNNILTNQFHTNLETMISISALFINHVSHQLPLADTSPNSSHADSLKLVPTIHRYDYFAFLKNAFLSSRLLLTFTQKAVAAAETTTNRPKSVPHFKIHFSDFQSLFLEKILDGDVLPIADIRWCSMLNAVPYPFLTWNLLMSYP